MRRSVPVSLSLSAFVLAALVPGVAAAAVLSETFVFTVTEIDDGIPGDVIALGDTVSATFSFDTEATDPVAGGFRTGTLSIEGFGAAGASASSFASTSFQNDLGSDAGCCFDRIIFSGENPTTLGISSLLLIDYDGEVLSSSDVPTSFDFSLIDTATLNVGLFEGLASFSAVYTRPETPGGDPEMPAVPLPAGFPLLAAALGAAGLLRRRRA